MLAACIFSLFVSGSALLARGFSLVFRTLFFYFEFQFSLVDLYSLIFNKLAFNALALIIKIEGMLVAWLILRLMIFGHIVFGY